MAKTRRYTPLPPGDEDLERMSPGTLMGEVASLTVYINRVDAWRVRRARAFRLLRAADVDRNTIATMAGVSPAAINNLVADLERGEAAWRDQQRTIPDVEPDETPAPSDAPSVPVTGAETADAAAPQPPCDRCQHPNSWHRAYDAGPNGIKHRCFGVEVSDETEATTRRRCWCPDYVEVPT